MVNANGTAVIGVRSRGNAEDGALIGSLQPFQNDNRCTYGLI
ncbi:MAG: hypothetical protein ACAF41_02815 [Leptolyngbya sp. BL-A-14]